ncbi:MAG TPA: GNAT family protein [bacterium]|nr:GNAT family protein [bacterium]
MSIINPVTFETSDGRSVVLRSPLSDDAEALVEYVRLIFSEHENLLFEPEEFVVSAAQEREWIRTHAESSSALIIAAFAGGEAVGIMNCFPGSCRRTSHDCTLGITLRRGWTGVGIGSEVMNLLLGWARSNVEVERLSLSVFSTNESAFEFYLKHGFVQEGRKEQAFKFSNGKYADEILMSCDVKTL